MPLHHAHVVPKPSCDAINVDSFARTDRSEGVAHYVRTDPWYTFCLHVVEKTTAEIEPVAVLPVRDIRLQHVRCAQTIALKEFGKLIRQRHCPDVADRDRKSTRLNSSHGSISYAVFCL